jgi:hypothetical protein
MCVTAVKMVWTKIEGDNYSQSVCTSVEAQIGKMRGPTHASPLLERLRMMLISFDIRLLPVASCERLGLRLMPEQMCYPATPKRPQL